MKRRQLILALILGFACWSPAAELTLDNVIEAHQVGVKPEILVQLIGTADTVPTVGFEEEARLREAGVTEQVITALKERGSKAAASDGEAVPDDPRMEQLVALVRAGLSQDLIIKQIRTGGVAYRPTTGDLIYLTSNNVPEAIISALIDSASVARAADPGSPQAPGAPAEVAALAAPAVVAAPVPATAPAPAAEPTAPSKAAAAAPQPAETEAAVEEEPTEVLRFGPLLRYKKAIGVTTDKRRGRVEIEGDTIRYVDFKKSKHNVEFFSKALKRVTISCEEHPDGAVCFELELKTVHGDEYKFRDTNWEAGGSEQIQALADTLEELYPTIDHRQKVK